MRTLQRNIKGSVGNVNLTNKELADEVALLAVALGLPEDQFDGFIWQNDSADFFALVVGIDGIAQNWTHIAPAGWTQDGGSSVFRPLYSAKIFQVGGAEPQLLSEDNNTGETATYSYDSSGDYRLTFGNDIAPAVEDIYVLISGDNKNFAVDASEVTAEAITTAIIRIQTANLVVNVGAPGVTPLQKSLADDILVDSTIMIWVKTS